MLVVTAIAVSGSDTSLGATTQTLVSLTFDNGTAGQYTLGYQQALAPAGVKATFYVSSGTVGQGPGFMTWGQLSDMASNGQDIGGKTVDGGNLMPLSPSQQTAEICNDRQALISHGLAPSTFAYPEGAYNAAIQAEAQSCGYGNARTADSIVSGPDSVNPESVPPRSWLGIGSYAPSQLTLANMEAVVTEASAAGGGWVPIVIGPVCSEALDPSNYQACTSSWGSVELADLQSFISWMQDAGQSGSAPTDAQFQTVGQIAASADTTPPQTTIACNGDACQSTQYDGTVSVTLSATDTGSGASSTHYTTDGSTPTLSSPLYTGDIKVTTTTTLTYRSWDQAGNAEQPQTQVIDVQQPEASDTTPPTTVATCGGSSCSASPYYAPVTVTLSATDNPDGWGVDKTYYTTDGSTPTTSSPVYNGPFVVNGPTTLQFFSTDLAGNAEQVQTQHLQVKTVVSLTFDDQYQDQWRYAWPLMQAHGMLGTFYVLTSDTDNRYTCCMSWAELDTLQAAGNDIGSHTITHPDLTTLSPADVQQEVCGSRQDLIAHGITDPVSFAYPFGTYNAAVEAIVQQCGFTNARAGGGVSNSNFTPTAPWLETLPPRDPMAVGTIAVDGASPMTLADLESFVTAASAHGGGWLPLTFHDVCHRSNRNFASCMASYGPVQDTVLGQFLTWLQAAGQPGGAPAGVTVMTTRAAMAAGAGS
jgi:peptidoglycan/xylan/chitin deacetylase (PgdA/CDA1 family)